MNMEVANRILEIVESVPRGAVTTYGEIAARAGTRAPRLVGRVLAELAHEDTPWHRVLRADGRCAHHLRAEQHAKLRAEGIVISHGRIDLRRYRWTD